MANGVILFCFILYCFLIKKKKKQQQQHTDQGTRDRVITGKIKCLPSYKTGNEKKPGYIAVSKSGGTLCP